MPRPLQVLHVASFALALLALCACDELSEFRTEPGEVFHGQVIGNSSDPRSTSFIREGFPSHTQLDLTFDPALAASPGLGKPKEREPAGTLDTYMCPPETDLCAKSKRTPSWFEGAALEPIDDLGHDALSQYDFPGGGRLRNYILQARVRREAADGLDRSAMVFVSLMENGKVEVRVIAASVRDEAGEDIQPALFGVFLLERRKP